MRNSAIRHTFCCWSGAFGFVPDEVKIQVVTTTNDAFSLKLENGISLKVGLTDKDYIGPEAMVLEGANGPIKVWL